MSHNTLTTTPRPEPLVDPGSLGTSRRFVGGCLLVAPVLMAVAAGLFVGEVGVTAAPFDNGSWVEGVLGVFALAAFVPVYLALANRLAAHRPRLAGIARVTGLIGPVAGVTWESLRVFGRGMIASGMTAEQAQRFLDEQLKYSWPMTASVLFPLTSVLLGFALAGRGLPRWQGLALAGGGLGFVAAEALELATKVTYPLGAALWLVALVPLGLATLRHPAVTRRPTVVGSPANAPAAA